MFTVKVRDFIASAHFLREYKGKCENMHGHNWKVEATIAKAEVGSDGMVMDFKILKKHLKEIVDSMDHKVLNEEVDYFKTVNPSSENIAKYIYGILKEKIKDSECVVSQIDVWEQRDSCATYYE